MKINTLLCVAFLCAHLSLSSRNIYRPADPHLPSIVAQWVGDSKTYTLRNSHLEDYALTLFNEADFYRWLVPEKISFRNDEQKMIDAQIVRNLIDDLIVQIKKGKQTFQHFTILQDKDFTFKQAKGLLIVKFNDYPFVVKLFMETPDSFVKPFDKGLDPTWFFFMGGGVNRHLNGFTRIKNREYLCTRIKDCPWAPNIDIPRKWHILPKDNRWIQITAHNIGGCPQKIIQFPGTYVILADAIEAERSLSLLDAHDRKFALDVCNYLDLWIDPHMKNFMIEKNTKKFVIVDTEHFPTSVGLREKVYFDNYCNWYLYLAGKCWQNTFMQTKKERRHPKRHSPEMSIKEHRFFSELYEPVQLATNQKVQQNEKIT